MPKVSTIKSLHLLYSSFICYRSCSRRFICKWMQRQRHLVCAWLWKCVIDSYVRTALFNGFTDSVSQVLITAHCMLRLDALGIHSGVCPQCDRKLSPSQGWELMLLTAGGLCWCRRSDQASPTWLLLFIWVLLSVAGSCEIHSSGI